MDYFQQVRMTGQENPDAPDEPKQATEPVYVVRLTEGDLDELKECSTDEMNHAVLRHARPEHPKQQEALKELIESTMALEVQYGMDRAWLDNTPDTVLRFVRARMKLRSLEGK